MLKKIKAALMAIVGIALVILGKKLQQGTQAKKDVQQLQAKQTASKQQQERANELQNEANKAKAATTTTNVVSNLNGLFNPDN
ncbi:MAG: hypothetical protein FWE37_02210 [Spirochaetaceae bacterium]|nr:hypothetical protein [Spirochaetaceae bacterium]